MDVRASWAALAASIAIGCGPNHGERAGAVEHEDDTSTAKPARFTGDAPRFRAEVGPYGVSLAIPRDYASSVAFSSFRRRTMEITESEQSTGVGALSLEGAPADAGAAHGCFASRWSMHVSTSAYASSDGKPHDDEDARRTLLGVRGRWRRDARGWMVVELAQAPDQCPPPPSLAPSQGASTITLRCIGVALKGTESSLACMDEGGHLHDVSLPLGGKGERWLLLGTAPGLAIDLEEGRETVTFELTRAKVEIDAAKWMH